MVMDLLVSLWAFSGEALYDMKEVLGFDILGQEGLRWHCTMVCLHVLCLYNQGGKRALGNSKPQIEDDILKKGMT